MNIAQQVANAIVRINSSAGQSWDTEAPQSNKVRAENLLREGKHGAYIVEGDPYGWASGAVATILMEAKGGDGDCIVPLDYYGNGMEESMQASDYLDGIYIEFINAAVACVFKC